jgi:hypothetical protein
MTLSTAGLMDAEKKILDESVVFSFMILVSRVGMDGSAIGRI